MSGSREPRPAWPQVEIRLWMRLVAVLLFPMCLAFYVLLTVPALIWSACAVTMDGAFPGRVNWWHPLWEGTAYYEARSRAAGGGTRR